MPLALKHGRFVPDMADPPFGLPPEDPAIEAYYRHGSVWKAGVELGIPGQRVHAILKRAGVVLRHPEFSEWQIRRIKEYYQSTTKNAFNLQELADELGKSRANVCRAARKLGLTDLTRRRKSDKPRRKRPPLSPGERRPGPMTGKKHSLATKAILSARSKQTWATHKTFGIGLMSEESRDKRSARMQRIAALRPASKNYSRTKLGSRPDLGGQFFRSSWEANFARYLNLLIKFKVVESWQYEPETFWFEGIRRGTTNYRPDFRVLYRGDPVPEYIEIKGWIVSKDHTKWSRMAKYHPQIKLRVVKEKEYYSIQKKWSSAIPTWEKPQRGRP